MWGDLQVKLRGYENFDFSQTDMSNSIRGILGVCLGLILAFFLHFDSADARLLSAYEYDNYKPKVDAIKSNEEKVLDDLLGPDVDFPFRPENHRDNSNPIAGIDPISN